MQRWECMTTLMLLTGLAMAVGADEACCARAATFFGSSSTLASRNCYCDPDVLERLMAAEELADLSSTDFFDSCACVSIRAQMEASACIMRLRAYRMSSQRRRSHAPRHEGHARLCCLCHLQA